MVNQSTVRSSALFGQKHEYTDIQTAQSFAAWRCMRLLGARVTRPIFLDDGTWMREGDACLPRSPLRRGLVIKAHREEITVRWDDGREQVLLSHGADREIASS